MESAYYVLVAFVLLYWVLFAVSIMRGIWLILNSKRPSWSITKIFCCLVPLIFGVHAVDLTIHLHLNGDKFFIEPFAEQTPITMILDSLPGYIFISTYILLGLFWYTLYSKAFQTSIIIVKHMRRIYGLINLALYTIWIFLYIMLSFSQWTSQVHMAEATFTTTITLIVAGIFLVGGSKLYFMVKKNSIVSQERWRIARKVAVLTVLCTVVFLIRGVLIFGSFYFIKDPLPTLLLKVGSLVFLEIIPSLSIMIIVKPSTKSRYSSSSPSSPTSSSSAEKVPLNRSTPRQSQKLMQ